MDSILRFFTDTEVSLISKLRSVSFHLEALCMQPKYYSNSPLKSIEEILRELYVTLW